MLATDHRSIIYTMLQRCSPTSSSSKSSAPTSPCWVTAPTRTLHPATPALTPLMYVCLSFSLARVRGKLRSEVGAIRNGVCCMSTGQRVASVDRLVMCHMQYKPDASVALVDTATTSQYTTGGQYPGWSGYYLVRAFTHVCLVCPTCFSHGLASYARSCRFSLL